MAVVDNGIHEDVRLVVTDILVLLDGGSVLLHVFHPSVVDIARVVIRRVVRSKEAHFVIYN